MIRWIARIASLIGIFFLIGYFQPAKFHAFGVAEWVLFAFIPCVLLSGYLLSWMYDRTGAAVSVGAIVIYYILHLSMNTDLHQGYDLLLYLIPPVLFLLSRLIEGKPETKSK